MDFTRKLPVGIQSFEKLRRNGYIYIDKTPFIWRLIQSSNPYFLSRPRRFGKSLFLSTLAAYFRGQKDLFKDLYIEQAEEKQAQLEKRTSWQVYPVLYLDFNVGKYTDTEALNERLHVLLDYAAPYKARGKKIILIGAESNEKTKTIHDWQIAVAN